MIVSRKSAYTVLVSCRMLSLPKFAAVLCLISAHQAAVLNNQPVDIVVIGAGAAGITAASELIRNGHRVTILEAEGRKGGRMLDVSFETASIELGAEVVWGNSGFLYDFVKANNLLRTGSGTNPVRISLLEDGPVSNPTKIEQIRQIQESINQLVQTVTDTTPGTPPPLSLGAELDKAFEAYVAAGTPDPTLARAVYDKQVRSLKTLQSVDSLHDVSVHELTDRRDGAPAAPLTTTYTKAIEQLGSNIPADAFVLNQKVVKIAFDPAKPGGYPVTVTTATGAVHKAHHVVVTASLGVLKRDAATLFAPALPQRKTDAIAAAGFGTLGKIVLLYDEAFWAPLHAESISTLPMLWTSDLPGLNPDKRYIGKAWTRGIDEIKVFGKIGSKYAISTFIGGHLAEEVEHLTDLELILDLSPVIARFLGRPVPAAAPQVFRGKWHSSENFRGSFSSISHDFTTKGFKISDLEAPVFEYDSDFTGSKVPAILFAGEATDAQYFGHVTAAVQSGHREGVRISDYYKNVTARPSPTSTSKPSAGHRNVVTLQLQICGFIAILFTVL